MRTLDEIYGRCVPDEITGCKLWRGCTDKYGPRIYAPDMRFGGQLKTQYDRRAVWQLVNSRPLPRGWRVFGTCGNPACLEYEHMQASTTAERGRKVAESGRQKGLMTRIVANRKIARKQTVLTPELIAEIRSSPETGLQLAARLGIGRSTISKARRHHFTSVEPTGFFTGLFR